MEHLCHQRKRLHSGQLQSAFSMSGKNPSVPYTSYLPTMPSEVGGVQIISVLQVSKQMNPEKFITSTINKQGNKEELIFWWGNSILSHLGMNKPASAYKLWGDLWCVHLKGCICFIGSCTASQAWMPGRPSAPETWPPTLTVTASSRNVWLPTGCSH